MAKEKKEEVVEEIKISTHPIKKAPTVKKDTWEIKDRQYYLTGDKEPLTFTIPARHSRRLSLIHI